MQRVAYGVVLVCLTGACLLGSGNVRAEEQGPAKTGRLNGVAVDAEGAPVADARVRVWSNECARSWWTHESVGQCFAPGGRFCEAAATRTDAGGRWSVEGLEAGAFYTIECEGPSGAMGRVTYAAAAEGLRSPVPLRLRAARILHGRIVDANGQGVPGFVSASSWSASNVWGAEGSTTGFVASQIATAADGRFRTRVPVGAHARIDAHVPGLGSGSGVALHGEGAEPSAAIDIAVGAAAGSRVAGTVRDDSGTPVAGARVVVQTGVARPWDPGPGMYGYAVTAADGTYRIAHLRGAVLIALVVSAPGHVLEQLPLPVRGPMTGTPLTAKRPFVADVVLQRARTIRGRVFDDRGTPLPHAWVDYTTGDATLSPIHVPRTRTDAKGRFEIWNAPTAAVRLHAGTSAHYQPVHPNDGKAGTPVPAGAAGAVQRVRIDVKRGRTLSGMLQDKAGAPVVGARVLLYVRRSGAIDSHMTFSSAGGRFFLDGLRDEDKNLELQVDMPGFVKAASNVAAGPAELAVPVIVVLERAARVQGVVLDVEDKPLAGVAVWCGDPNQRGVTDAAGRFDLEGVPPGRRLLACGPNRLALAQRGVDVAPGKTLSGLELRLTGTSVLGGIVVDAHDRPVAGEPVTATGMQQGTGMKTVRTDANGAFLMTHVPPGTYSLSPGRPQRRPPIVKAGSTDTRLVVEGRSTEIVEGVVRDPNGTLVPNGHVEMAFVGDGTIGVRGGSSLFAGRFRVGVPAGVERVILRVKRPAGANRRALNLMERSVEVAVDGTPVTIELPPALSITGVVMDAEGRGVPHVPVNAVPADRPRGQYGPVESTISDAKGRFTLIGLAARTYRITTLAAGPWAPSEPVDAKAEATEDVLVPVLRFRRFFGRILDAKGAPVPEVQIMATAKHRTAGLAIAYRNGRRTSFSTRTASDGRFSLDYMPPDFVYDIWFHVPLAMRSTHFPVKLERHDPKAAPYELKLRAGLTVTGRVTGTDGKPVQHVVVNTHAPKKPDGSYDPEVRRQAYTQADGSYTVGPLPEGAKLSVTFGLSPHRHKDLPWLSQTRDDIVAGTTGLDVVLNAGVAIVGRVAGATPEELKNISLTLKHKTQRMYRSFRFDGQSTEFRFGALQPGPYVLTASVGGNRKVELPYRTEVKAPAANVVLLRRVKAPLRGKLLGVKNPGAYRAEFLEDSKPRHTRPVRVAKDGTFDLGERYNNPGVLLITSSARTHVVYMRLPAERQFVKANAVKTKTIRGRVHGLPHKISGGRAFVREGRVTFTGTIADDGWFEIRGLPPGSWNVAITASRPTGGTFEVKNPIRAGKHNVRVHWR